MHDASEDISDAFVAARVFYMHDMDDIEGEAPPSITHERVSRTSDDARSRKVMKLAAQAARTIRTLLIALSALPQLKKLDVDVAAYVARSAVREKRQSRPFYKIWFGVVSVHCLGR